MPKRDRLTALFGMVDAMPWDRVENEPEVPGEDPDPFDEDLPDDRDPADYGSTRHV